MTKIKITNETGWQSKIIDCPEIASVDNHAQAMAAFRSCRYLIEMNSCGRVPVVHLNSDGYSWLFNAKTCEFYGKIPETF